MRAVAFTTTTLSLGEEEVGKGDDETTMRRVACCDEVKGRTFPARALPHAQRSQRPTTHVRWAAGKGEGGGCSSHVNREACQTSRCLEGGVVMNGSLHMRLKSPLR